jgi:hypothetical protein
VICTRHGGCSWFESVRARFCRRFLRACRSCPELPSCVVSPRHHRRGSDEPPFAVACPVRRPLPLRSLRHGVFHPRSLRISASFARQPKRPLHPPCQSTVRCAQAAACIRSALRLYASDPFPLALVDRATRILLLSQNIYWQPPGVLPIPFPFGDLVEPVTRRPRGLDGALSESGPRMSRQVPSARRAAAGGRGDRDASQLTPGESVSQTGEQDDEEM